MTDLQPLKRRCIGDLAAALPRYRQRLDDIDTRLYDYCADAITGDGSHCNIYEALGIRKVLRLMDSYDLDIRRVQRTLRAIEGQWEDGHHVKGGLKFSTPRGQQHVRLMPYQVWCVFGIYGFTTEADMERDYHEGDTLLPTEYVVDGRVWDRRRLTTDCHLFQTRKSGKTEFGAAIDFVEACFLGDVNAQVLICANSREQAKIAYKAVKAFATQVDPTCLNRMGGKYFRLTADELNWQPTQPRQGEIKVMSAGGKTKDGLYASMVHADEHGQAAYVNGSSDMQSLVDVCQGSMGPRREKLLLHTTTAGLVSEGPYKSQIETVERTLLTELDHPLGQPCRTPDDYWFAFLLRLDPWETDYTLEQLDDAEIFRKVNRSIGTTVQPTWYKERLHSARLSDDTRQEVLTKDFNIWKTGKVVEWIRGERIRPLQTSRRLTDCKLEDGWNTFVGLDFGGNDDFMAISTLSVNYSQGLEMHDRFFADMIAWTCEGALRESPNRKLYEKWIADGYLRVCPGDVFEPALAVNELMALSQYGVNIAMLGYDPAQSRDPINNISAWLQSLGIYPENIKNMLVPVAQSAMNMNQVVLRIEYMVLSQDPWLRFSDNPIWPWQFGNCGVEIGRTDLRRVVKGGTHPGKIDNVAALLDALWCFDLSEGQIG